jgi:hypothetical protein
VAGIRFTKAERAVIRYMLSGPSDSLLASEKKAAASVLEKLDLSELVKGKKRSAGLGAARACEVFAQVLGPRLVRPPPGAVEIYGAIGNRVRQLALTEEDCHYIATKASHLWTGMIKAESIVRNAEMLMAVDVGTPAKPVSRVAAPVGMEDI